MGFFNGDPMTIVEQIKKNACENNIGRRSNVSADDIDWSVQLIVNKMVAVNTFDNLGGKGDMSLFDNVSNRVGVSVGAPVDYLEVQ